MNCNKNIELTPYQMLRAQYGLDPMGELLEGLHLIRLDSKLRLSGATFLNIGTVPVRFMYVRYDGGFKGTPQYITCNPCEKVGFTDAEDYSIVGGELTRIAGNY